MYTIATVGRIHRCMIGLLGSLCVASVSVFADSPERVLVFSSDYSIGDVFIEKESFGRQIKDFDYYLRGSQWQYHRPARGRLTIPAGHRVKLELAPSLWENRNRADDLTKLDPNAIFCLAIMPRSPGPPLSSDWLMPSIASLTGLRELYLYSVRFSGDSMKLLSRCTQLETLWAPDQLTNGGLNAISHLKTLKSLTLGGPLISDKALMLLKNLPQLEELTLSGEKLTDGALPHIALLPQIKWLYLQGNFSDASMEHLAMCPNLRVLEVYIDTFGDEGMRHISRISNLEGFKAHWMQRITDEGVAHLKNAPHLKRLDIKHASLTQKSFQLLGTKPQLEYLMLPDHCTDADVEMLSALKHLKFLWIGTSSNSLLSDRSFEVISGFDELEELHIAGKGITDAGVKSLQKLNRLRTLHIGWNSLSDRGLESIAGIGTLERLSLNPEQAFTTDGLNHLNTLTCLKRLECENTKKGRQPLDLGGLRSLEELIINMDRNFKVKDVQKTYYSLLSDADVEFCKGMEHINGFSIRGAEISATGLESIVRMPQLRYLSLSGPLKLTDAGLSVLKPDSTVHAISLDTGHFTGACLEPLAKLKNLKSLQLTSDDAFSHDKIEAFKNQTKLQRLELKP